MGFTWTKFGIMAPPRQDDRYLYAVNTEGEVRKLSLRTYPTGPALKAKCTSLIGHPTVIRTSQNTANWSTSEWFSDVSLDDSNVEQLSVSGSDKVIESVESLKQKVDALGLQVNNVIQENAQHRATEKEEIAKYELEAAQQKIAALESQIKEIKANKLTDTAISLAHKANQRTAVAENELKEKELIISQLQEERSMLPQKDKWSIYEEQKELQKNHPQIIGKHHKIKVVGHPRRTLILRTGLTTHNDSLNMQILEHYDGNSYLAEIVTEEKTKVIVALGYSERRGLFAYTFKNLNAGWHEAERRVTGLNENILKNRTDVTDEELLKHFNNVKDEIALTF